MQPFVSLTAVAAPLPNANIDTDQIIPARYLKTVERTGLGAGLFAASRFDAGGAPRPDFVLNRPEYAGAAILIAGDNFGCGSSREHAPWALLDFGVRCVVSTGFADIFYGNSLNNGLLPAVVGADDLQRLLDQARGGNHRFTVDLPSQTITAPDGTVVPFQIGAGQREKLLRGLDPIGETLQAADAIAAYEAARDAQPWARPLEPAA